MKTITKILTLFLVFLLFAGCAAKLSVLPEFKAEQFDTNLYDSKVDNFLIIFDASSSMTDDKFHIANETAKRLNATIPFMNQTAGLRSFGHSLQLTSKPTKLFYKMSKYSSKDLEQSLKQISMAGGRTPLHKALNAAFLDFKDLSGNNNAIIIISDGIADETDKVLSNANKFKDIDNTSTCFYPIFVGNKNKNSTGQNLLKQIANTSDCGFHSTSSKLLKSDDMAAFVEKVFLFKKESMAKSLSDKKTVILEGDVLFDFDKYIVKPSAYNLLNGLAKALAQNPSLTVSFHGHCDNIGTAEYNQVLSKKRAKAVKEYMIKKGIQEYRMKTKGFGFTKPVAPNDTKEGRQKNRRVEIQP